MKSRGFKIAEFDGEELWANGKITLWTERVDGVQHVFVGAADGSYARQIPSNVLAALSAEKGTTP